jgi:hypothetical protein
MSKNHHVDVPQLLGEGFCFTATIGRPTCLSHLDRSPGIGYLETVSVLGRKSSDFIPNATRLSARWVPLENKVREFTTSSMLTKASSGRHFGGAVDA